MYCVQCGHKLPNEARFCGACGAPVTGESVVVSQTASANEVAALPEGNHVTFAAAMDSAKKRSRRHIPVPILVVLVALFMSSVAFASYLVYTNVIAPPEEPALQEEVVEGISPWDKAVEQYQVVLDQYRQFDAEFPNGTHDAYDSYDYEELDSVYEEMKSKYPYVNTDYDDYYGGYSEDYQLEHSYAYYDMDDDGIPELIVFYSSPYSDTGIDGSGNDGFVGTAEMRGCNVSGIYSIASGSVEMVDYSRFVRDGDLSFYGSYILSYYSGGAYAWGRDVLSFVDHQYVCVASFSLDGNVTANGGSTGEVTKTVDGVTTTEPFDNNSFDEVYDEFISPYKDSPIKDMEVFSLQ